jgi:hypothetical protein
MSLIQGVRPAEETLSQIWSSLVVSLKGGVVSHICLIMSRVAILPLERAVHAVRKVVIVTRQ